MNKEELKAAIAKEFETERNKIRATEQLTNEVGNALTSIEIEIQKILKEFNDSNK